MHVVCDRAAGWISILQEKYSNDVLERLGKTTCQPMVTPVLAGEHLMKVSAPEVDVKSYQSAVGALMYSMLGTCPDLAFAVGSLRRHSAKPSVEHQHTLKCTLHYLCGTSDHTLMFQCGTPGGTELLRYIDADWASNVNDRKSTLGIVFMLGGAAISWGSKKQNLVALSSTEAEYITVAHAAKEAIWLRCLLTELGKNLDSPTTLFVNNQSAIAIAWNPEFHDQTKHIEVQYHFLQKVVDSGKVHLKYLPTSEQITDVLTKGLSRENSSATDGLSTPSPIFNHNPRDEFGNNASISSISSYTHSTVSSMFSSSASDELSAPLPIFDHHPRSEDGDDNSISSVSSYAHSIVSSTFSSSATNGLSTLSPIFDYSPHKFSNDTFNSSYAHSTISSTHSSGTDRLSIPSPIFGHNPCDKSKVNVFSNVLEDLHHDISHLEMILEMLLTDSGKPEDESHVVIKGGLSDGADKVENT